MQWFRIKPSEGLGLIGLKSSNARGSGNSTWITVATEGPQFGAGRVI